MQKEVLSILGLFWKQDADLELLPPPPPFPDIGPKTPPKKAKSKEKTKIVLKHKESVDDILENALKPSTKEPEDFLSIDAPVVESSQELQDSDEITRAISDAKQKEKLSFWKRLFTKKREQTMPMGMSQDTSAAQDVGVPEQQEVVYERQPPTPTEEVMQKINRARKQLEDLDVKGAKETYVEIMKLYRMMTQKEQESVYESIQELYEERKAAEQMPK
jgi:hypothetical protein